MSEDKTIYEIESGIEVPRRHRDSLYPFHEMKVGDSFLVPKDKGKSAYISGIGFCKRNRPFLKCETRTEGGSVRVWLSAKPSPQEGA